MSRNEVDMDELRDEHLRRALAHAPDHAVAPDWRLRKAILAKAHEAIGATDPETDSAALEAAARPWWRRAPAAHGGRSRMPWNAAFATVLVAVLVGVLWHREPVPGPALDSQAPMKEVAPPSAPVAPPAARPDAARAAIPEASSAAPSSSSSFQLPMPGLESPSIDVPPEPPNAPLPPAEKQAAPATAAPARKQAARTPPAATPVTPPVAPSAAPFAAPPAAQPAAPPAAAQPAPSARERRDESAALRLPAPAGGLTPAPAGAPAAPAAPAAPTAAAKPATSNVRTDETEPPNFEALRSWNRITITRRSGETRSLPRSEARELNALLGSAALSAVGPRPLAGAPEWRVTLERNGEVQAVFEIAGSQVRWREGKLPPGTGVPSGPALAALREALSDAVQPPPPPQPQPQPQPAPVQPAPPEPSGSPP